MNAKEISNFSREEDGKVCISSKRDLPLMPEILFQDKDTILSLDGSQYMQDQEGDCCLAIQPWRKVYIDIGYALAYEHTITINLKEKKMLIVDVTNYSIQNKLHPVDTPVNQQGLIIFFTTWLLITIIVMTIFVVGQCGYEVWKFIYRKRIDPELDPNLEEIIEGDERDIQLQAKNNQSGKQVQITSEGLNTLDMSDFIDLNKSNSTINSLDKISPFSDDNIGGLPEIPNNLRQNLY